MINLKKIRITENNVRKYDYKLDGWHGSLVLSERKSNE